MLKRFSPLRALPAVLAVVAVATALIMSASCSWGELADVARGTSTAAFGDVPAYAGAPYTEVDGNVPSFTDADRSRTPFEEYGELDSLGRCTAAFALVGPETTSTEERGRIGDVRPSGWRISKYGFIDGKYLYNRCHLIAYALTAENANAGNLITGTRYLNTQGMLPFERRVAGYVGKTGNHVLYRSTPVFEADELVAQGVLLEAESVEDGGSGIRFKVYCHNVQPGVQIDYATGENRPDGTMSEGEDGTAAGDDGVRAEVDTAARAYVINTNTKRFHLPGCGSVADMKAKNRQDFDGTREEAIAAGYKPCGICKP